MTESSHEETNPLEALGLGGDGGFDMGALLQQAQQMQEQLQETQRTLAESKVDGSAGAVTVTVSGVGELLAVSIAPGSFDANDTESLEDLGDMVVAAYRDAKSKSDAIAAEALGPMAQAMGGSGFPGLG